MNNFFRTLIAGYGAKKLGGGCFSTILIFIVIYWALGTCNKSAPPARPSNGMHAPAKPSGTAAMLKTDHPLTVLLISSN